MRRFRQIDTPGIHEGHLQIAQDQLEVYVQERVLPERQKDGINDGGEIMQFNVEINHEKKCVHVKVYGRVNPGLFGKALTNSFSCAEFDSSYAQLIDLSNIEGLPVIEEFPTVVEVLGLMKAQLKNRIAVFADSAPVHTTAKLVSSLASREGLVLEVFDDIEKAREWLCR